MALIPALAAVLVTAAVFSYVNHRWIKLPTTIGVMLIALVMSVGLLVFEAIGIDVRSSVQPIVERLDFQETLLDGMLAFLLFAGALHVNLDDLLKAKWTIALLASVGLILSTLIVAGLTQVACNLVDVQVPFLHCLIFGALISPTDPIAVLGILKSAGAPKVLKTKITGESLFNDGFAVVLFLVLVRLAAAGEDASVGIGEIGSLFGVEVVGGVILGLGAGYVSYRMLKSVDNYQVEVLITLALAMGLYALAAALHSSGPLAVVVAGLFIGNTGRHYAMSKVTCEHLDTFWELVDEILNVILFLLIGMEFLVLATVPGVGFETSHLIVGLVAIPVALGARYVSVGGTVFALGRHRVLPKHAVKVLVWGGIRGGISVALALSLDPEVVPARDLLLTATYVVVIFSISVQGLTMGKLVRWVARQDPA